MTTHRSRWGEWSLVTLVTMLAALLRWVQIADEGMWLDEAFSVWMARQPVGALLEWIVRIDQHPPLYYLLLHGWMVLGESEGTLRALSALLGSAAVPALYWTGRRLYGVAGGTVAALLLALSPFHVRFGQEVRMYTLLVLCVSVALLALAHLVTGDHRRRWWVTFVIFSVAALLSHNTAVLYWFAVNAALLVAWWAQARWPDARLALPSLRAWLFGQAAILVLWLPWGASFMRQAAAVDREFWIPSPTSGVIWGTIKTFFSAWLPATGEPWVWIGTGVALGVGVLALVRRPALLALLLLLVVLPFAAELLVSLRRPIFYDRTLIWTTVPLFLMLGAGVAWAFSVQGRSLLSKAGTLFATAGVALLLVGNVQSLRSYYADFHKEEWREAAGWLAERVGPNDLLLFNATWVQIPFDYYFGQLGLDVEKRGAPVDLFDAGVLEPKMTEADIPRLQQTVQGFDCVWLVYSHDWYTDPDKIVPRVLRRELMSMKTQYFNGLQVQLYESRTGPRCPNNAP